MKIKYTLPDYNDEEDDFYEFEFDGGFDKEHPDFLAEKVAEDFFHNKDGWECDWPIKLVIMEIEGYNDWQPTAFEIDLESVPEFRAYKVA